MMSLLPAPLLDFAASARLFVLKGFQNLTAMPFYDGDFYPDHSDPAPPAQQYQYSDFPRTVPAVSHGIQSKNCRKHSAAIYGIN
jgi:hypothetical protein